MSRSEASVISDVCDCCVLWLDQDEAGNEAGVRWSRALRERGVETRSIGKTRYKDANDALLSGGVSCVQRLVQEGALGKLDWL